VSRRPGIRLLMGAVICGLVFDLVWSPAAARAVSPSDPPPPAASSGPATQAPGVVPTPAPSLLGPLPVDSQPGPPAAPAAAPDPATGLKSGATELSGARTEYSQTFDNHDGTKTTLFYADPTFYSPDGSSNLVPITVGFVPGVAGSYASSKAPVAVAVSAATSSGDFLTLASGGRSIGFRMPSGASQAMPQSAPVVSGNVADYRGVAPGVDLRVVANANGAKSFFIWRAIPARPSITYVVDAPGLTLRSEPDGSISILDGAQAVGSIPRPYAVDSTPDSLSGAGHFTDEVSLALGQDGKTISVSVDPNWLATAVYPVYVDPSAGLYNAGSSSYGDAHIASFYPTLNFDDYQRPDSPYYHELWNGTDPGGISGESYDYLRWDLSPYDYHNLSGSTLDSGSLKLYPYHEYYSSSSETTYVREVTGSWTETSPTWNNKPAYTTTGTVSAGCVQGSTCTWNVTAMVQKWLQYDSHDTNWGFQVDTIGKGSTFWKRFVSSEQGGSNRPVLSLTYHNPAVTAAAKPAFTGDRTVNWTYSDPASLAQTKFQVQLSTDGGATWPAALDSGNVAGPATSWSISSTMALADLTSYTWHVRAYNGSSWSPWSANQTFTYDAYERGSEPFYAQIPFSLGGGWTLGVSAQKGEAAVSRALYSIPTIGPAGDLTLAYNSSDINGAGTFGYGWSSNLTQHLWLNNSTSPTLVVWARADGGLVAFAGSGSAWAAVPGHFETLSYVGSPTNEYTITEKDQTKLVFESTGSYRLKRIVDRFGKALTLSYSSASITATDAVGRTTTIALDGSSHADSVTDTAGRVWDFTVNSASGDLTALTEPDPDGGGSLPAPSASFGYAAHLLTTVTRHRRTAAGGDDTIVWTIGYSSGKATSIVDPVAHAMYSDAANTITYNAGNTIANVLSSYTPAIRNSTTYAFDSAGWQTSVMDPLSGTTSFTWNGDGTLAQTIDPNLVETDFVYSSDDRRNLVLQTSDVTGLPVTTKYDYDASNDNTKIYVAFGSTDEVDTEYTYDALGTGGTPGHLVMVKENSAGAAPNVSQLAYNANDEVVAELDPSGSTTTHAYDADGNDTQTVSNCTNTGTTPPGDPAWKTCAASGTHDSSTNVTRTATYTLTSLAGKLGLAGTTVDATNQSTTLVYDNLGMLTSQTTPAGTTTHEWDEFGNELRTVAPGSLTTTKTYDFANRLTVQAGPGPTTTTTFNADGSIATRTIATESVSRTYDSAGNLLTEVVDPGSSPHLNLVTEHAYDAAGREVAVRKPAPTTNPADLKTITRTWYDASGRVTQVVENCTNTGTTIPDVGWAACAGTGTHDGTWNLTTTTSYDDRGNKVKVVAPNGRVTTYTYDDLDHLVKQIDNYVASPSSPVEDVTTEFAYDADGNQIAVKAPTNVGGSTGYTITRLFYDSLGRKIESITNCTNSGTTPPADPAWKTCAGTGTADASTNLVTLYSYDAEGRQIAVTAPDPSAVLGTSTATTTTRYAYDSAGRLCRVLENASVDLQTLAHPCSDSVSGTTTANISTTYGYDGVGNLTSSTDGNGHTTSYGRDAQGRMISLQDPLMASLSWAFDDNARTKTQTNRTDSTPLTPTMTWTYDAADRLSSRSYLDDAGNPHTTSYAYDSAGNLLTATDGSSTISITSDRLGRPVTVTVSGDAGATTTYTYGFSSASRVDASGSYSMALDPFSRTTSLTDPIHASPFTWVYGGDGQVASSTAPNGNSTSFGYDSTGRLLSKTTGPRANYQYSYNRAGQLIAESSTITGDPGNGTATTAFDPVERLASFSLPGITSLAAAWNSVPDRTSLTTDSIPTTQTFDAANRVTSGGYVFDADGRLVARPVGSGGALEWDSLGRLDRVRATLGGTILAQYTYDALDRLLTVDRSGTRLRFRYQGATTSVAQIVNDVSGAVVSNLATDSDGTILEDWLGSVRHIYGTNAHGDVTWTSDDSGAVISTARYDPWGNLIASSGSVPDWRFQGSWFDTATKLSWAQARWYDSVLGSFISEDPVAAGQEDPQSRQLFAYGAGDPVDRADASGQFWYTIQANDWLGGIVSKFFGQDTWDLRHLVVVKNPGFRVIAGSCVWIPKIVGSAREAEYRFDHSCAPLHYADLFRPDRPVWPDRSGYTSAFCVSAAAGAGAYGTVVDCVAKDDTGRRAGLITVGGGGVTGFTLGWSVGLQLANGRISDMAGIFGTSGVTVGWGAMTYAGEISYSQHVMAVFLGLGPKVRLPLPGEFHSGITYTWVVPYSTWMDSVSMAPAWGLVNFGLWIESLGG
jgi:RHS repeat-associated protein